MSDSLNNKRVLSGGYWILFSNPPLKFELDKLEGLLTGESLVTQHTTACCSIQVVDITLVKYQFKNITSLRVVQ
jgi:hypothetical protein